MFSSIAGCTLGCMLNEFKEEKFEEWKEKLKDFEDKFIEFEEAEGPI